MRKAFTLIEILVALLSVSIITLFSFDYLSNTITVKNQLTFQTTKQQKYTNAINAIRLDLMQLTRMPMKDLNGRYTGVTFFGNYENELMTFISLGASSQNDIVSKLRRITYVFENGQLIRKSSPSNRPSALTSEKLLFKNIENLTISFSDSWEEGKYNQWPNNNYPLDAVPRYIFLDITIDGDEFSYLLSSF